MQTEKYISRNYYLKEKKNLNSLYHVMKKSNQNLYNMRSVM